MQHLLSEHRGVHHCESRSNQTLFPSSRIPSTKKNTKESIYHNMMNPPIFVNVTTVANRLLY